LSSADEEEEHASSNAHAKSLHKHRATQPSTATQSAVESSKSKAKLSVTTQVKRNPFIVSSSDDEFTGATPVNSGNGPLPAFARSGWTTRFLPTLVHCLASASDPWDIGNGVDIIVVIQGVLDKAYPNSGYRVKYGDKVYSMV
jgi:hypothetical protein